MDENRLNKLKELLKLTSEGLTREEFVSEFKKILEIFLAMKIATEKKQKEIVALAEKTLAEIENKTNNYTEKEADTLRTLFARLEKQQQDDLNFVKDKVRGLTDGEDGHTPTKSELEEIIKPLIPPVVEAKEMTAEQLRDKLESLNDDNKLRIEAIYKLEERLKELENRPVYKGGSIGGGFSVNAMELHIVDDSTPTGSVDGANTNFVLSHTPSPSTSLKLYVNGQRVKLTEDFSISGTTITFVTAPPTGSIITADFRI
jgi:hypothetical protein